MRVGRERRDNTSSYWHSLLDVEAAICDSWLQLCCTTVYFEVLCMLSELMCIVPQVRMIGVKNRYDVTHAAEETAGFRNVAIALCFNSPIAVEYGGSFSLPLSLSDSSLTSIRLSVFRLFLPPFPRFNL